MRSSECWLCFYTTRTHSIYQLFFIRVFFHRHWRITGQQGKGGDHLYSSPLLPPANEHSDIYLQIFAWGDYHVFLCRSLITTRWDLPPRRITIWLRDESMQCLFIWWFNSRLCYSNLTRETGRFQLASIITSFTSQPTLVTPLEVHRNFCSFRWLKLNLEQFSNFTPLI